MTPRICSSKGHAAASTTPFTLRHGDLDTVKAVMRAHWGRPRVAGSTWAWKKPDQTITAEVDDYSTAVTIHPL